MRVEREADQRSEPIVFHRHNDLAEGPEEQRTVAGTPRSCSRYAIRTVALSLILPGARGFGSPSWKAERPRTTRVEHCEIWVDRVHGADGDSR